MTMTDHHTLPLQKKFEIAGIPDPLAPYEEKIKPAYGLQWAHIIQQEWFGGGMISDTSLFAVRHQWIREMRLYNRGEQDVQQYKDILCRNEEDKKLLNLDWNTTNYAEKFTNIVKNGISEEFYRIDIRSADRLSLLQRQKKVMQHKKNMYSKAMLERAKEVLGIDMVPKGFVPEDEEELSLYTDIKERPKQEIAEEISINFVKAVSRWDHIKDDCDKDIVVVDLMAARVDTDPNNGVLANYVDPEAFGHSYVERNDFSDAYYFFVVDTITINDLRRESRFTEAQIRSIAAMYSTYNQTGAMDLQSCPFAKVLDMRIHVMRFCVKGDREFIAKVYRDRKGKAKKVAVRDSAYEVPEGAEDRRIEKRMDTWYEGNYIVGSQKYIYGWKESENLATDSMDRAMPPFIAQSTNIYRNKLKSFLSNIIPTINKLILADLKIQHLMMELKPDLTVINLDQLAELESVAEGSGEKEKMKDWKQALSILSVKGVVLEQTIDMGDEGGIQRGQSARPSPNQQGSALVPLLNVWAHYYNIIRETTGINPARDGSLSPDTLVGVNQMMQLASNTATKHIVDAAVRFDKRVCETISARIKGIFSLDAAKHLQKMYESAVGKENIDALEGLKDRHLHEFGFTVEMVPAKQELDELREDLVIALQEGTVDVSEKSEIMRLGRTNIKQANEYMRFIRRRKIKERMKETAYNQELQSRSNAQAAQAKMQSDITVYAQKKQADLQYEAQMSQIRMAEKEAANQIDAPKEALQFQRDVYKERMKALATIELTKYKEDEKRSREQEGDTRASKMIEQRKKDSGTMDFTESWDLADLLN